MSKAYPESKFIRETMDLLYKSHWHGFHDWAVNFKHINIPGYPDIQALWAGSSRATSFIVDLKVDGRQLTPEQDSWLMHFHMCGYNTFVWREEHWDMMIHHITNHILPPMESRHGWYALNEGYRRTIKDVMTIDEILEAREKRRLKTIGKRRGKAPTSKTTRTKDS